MNTWPFTLAEKVTGRLKAMGGVYKKDGFDTIWFDSITDLVIILISPSTHGDLHRDSFKLGYQMSQ